MAALYLFSAILLVSLNPVWIQLALWGGASSLALIFWQAVFAVLLYSGFALIRHRKLFNVNRASVGPLLLLGIAGFFFMALFFTLSLERLSASYTVMLFFSYPFFVLVGNAAFFRIRLRRLDILSLVILFSGVLVTTRPGAGVVSALGIMLALGAALAHAFFILYSHHNLQKVRPLQVSMFVQFGFLVGAAFLLLFIPEGALLQPAAIGYGFILAVLSSFFGFLLFLNGVAGLGARKAAVYSVVNLPMSLFFAWLFLGELLGLHLLLGLILILSGIIIESRSSIEAGNSDD
ncbi:MAG: DMT family transporter [Clostridiales bacterium]|jgi:drug/metabolite transporter (DMT)-like permease|nr:DMT family transporter [Clostridiales bacterium]